MFEGVAIKSTVTFELRLLGSSVPRTPKTEVCPACQTPEYVSGTDQILCVWVCICCICLECRVRNVYRYRFSRLYHRKFVVGN